MSFDFKLEVLLNHKKNLQNEAVRSWAEAQARVDHATEQLNALYKAVDDIRTSSQAITQEGGAQATRLVQNDQFIAGQGLRIERQRLVIRELKSETEVLHDAMVEASKETKMLEKLKEKQSAEYKKKQRVKEMKENDELVVLRHKPTGSQ